VVIVSSKFNRNCGKPARYRQTLARVPRTVLIVDFLYSPPKIRHLISCNPWNYLNKSKMAQKLPAVNFNI